jgi:hypothetical protein
MAGRSIWAGNAGKRGVPGAESLACDIEVASSKSE